MPRDLPSNPSESFKRRNPSLYPASTNIDKEISKAVDMVWPKYMGTNKQGFKITPPSAPKPSGARLTTKTTQHTPKSQKLAKSNPRSRNGYNQEVVRQWFVDNGLPEPVFEYRFDPGRMWRIDISWPYNKVGVECDGGIWRYGAHNRGAQIKKTWEKENTLNLAGWTLLKVEPMDLCTMEFLGLVKRALGHESPAGS